MNDIQQITIKQGVRWSETLDIGDYTDAGELISVMDLTGWTSDFAIADDDTGESLLTLSVGSGITIDGPLGTIDLEILTAQTAAMGFRRATAALRLIRPDGEVDECINYHITLDN